MTSAGREPSIEALVNWLLENDAEPVTDSSSAESDSSCVDSDDDLLGAAAAPHHHIGPLVHHRHGYILHIG